MYLSFIYHGCFEASITNKGCPVDLLFTLDTCKNMPEYVVLKVCHDTEVCCLSFCFGTNLYALASYYLPIESAHSSPYAPNFIASVAFTSICRILNFLYLL
jgi:hypothetical protein